MTQEKVIEFFKSHKNEWFIARDVRKALSIIDKNLHTTLNALHKKGILEKSQIGMYYNFRMKC